MFMKLETILLVHAARLQSKDICEQKPQFRADI
jgi:hypothetical protein